MSFFSFLYNLVLGPLILLFDVVYAIMLRMTKKEGLAIIALSLAINFLILPLYRRADAMQEEERVRTEKLSRGVAHIKKTFKGDERFMMLQTYYRQNGYKPYYALNGSLSLLLEIPFFIAAYNFLSGLQILSGASFGPIRDLGQPDGLLHFGSHPVNLLPVLMTFINIVSGYIYTKGMPLKSKLQLYGMALIFLVFLYSSPAGLVFYWTLNNLFSLVKNIFYRIKNPKLVLCAICTGLAAVCLPYVLIANPIGTPRMRLFVVTALLMLLLPLPGYFWIKKHNVRTVQISDATKTDNLIFYACCVFMALLTGLLIPSAVIASSPAEFVNVSAFRSPLRYLVSSSALAAGTFLIWFNIFYRLTVPKVRKIISLCMVVLSGSSALNYMLFGKNYGNMSSLLQYDNIIDSAKSDYLVNTLALAGLAAALVAVWKLRRIIIQSVSIALCAAVAIMSCMNVFSIQSTISELSQSLTGVSSDQGISFSLDKKGKNVIVIMMDRAIGEFFPYLLQEKPELQEQFAGFTYYPNTITYGNCTMVGFAGLYGGYEYIPDEMNSRDDLTIPQKQDEALKIMPGLFWENGYEVTVCDPTFAGFHWMPILGIYDDYPGMKRYITKGRFLDAINAGATDALLNRNLFAYSVFRTSPVMLHLSFYNKGLYNHSDKSSGIQVINSLYTASGGFDGTDSKFVGAYGVLKNLPVITEITDSGKNTFMMMSNDTAHDIVMLQEPAFEPADAVDNTQYESEHKVRTSVDGSEISFKNAKQLSHYQCNMAAMIQLGRWMDYLRENGVYDNTRIIIVSDHGRNLDYLYDKRIENGKGNTTPSVNDALIFDSLLLVKDFGSEELTFDKTFMTNADTPTLAFSGLIENPVNPFTGNQINSEGKNVSEHHIATTKVWSIDDYTGNEKTYKDIVWVGFKGTDTSDMNSWRVIGEKLSRKTAKAEK
ncbi:MAG: membrane protein insertase YidC [Clostridia bacterium]|nr:membrane protein insertase YidC [Clostridia bacterium]